ncbi:hypothetical protein Pla86_28170 [Planctomycetes bacterium Pla86]|uniref:Uncharacterized protein n=2 Tax=Engelhardtia mirabilis TaxID=2528011 RepID=A0A518BL76_9BACT|nr:hypothetical protein Pla133_28180 [Planctomycetes bacterium Pla133]QDV02056.1 hypothetical protein Pla86_28170 [Planctomycetes bacterium Pla86]
MVARDGSASQDPLSGKVENLNREGGKAGRRSAVRYRLVCPVCGLCPITPNNLPAHLRSRQCSRVHTKDEAAELAKTAPRDPRPFQEAVDLADNLIGNWEKRLETETRPIAIQAITDTLEGMRLQYRRLLDIGPNNYVPPEGFYDRERENER